MTNTNRKCVNSLLENTPNDFAKNHLQDTVFLRNATKTLKNNVINIENLITELTSVKKDLCIKTNHFQNYKKIHNLLIRLHHFLNVKFKDKTLEFSEIIAYSKFKDNSVSGVRITLNISPVNKGENIMLSYYKNRYYNDVIIKTFYSLEKEIRLFKNLHMMNTHKRRILNNLLNEAKELKTYLKNSNILHLLYFKREFRNLDPLSNNINSIICYYYWTEKTNNLIENSMDLWK